MRTIAPPSLGPGEEAQIHLLDQRGRLHGVALPFAAKVTAGEPLHFGADQGHETIQRRAVTLMPASQHPRNIVRLGHPNSSFCWGNHNKKNLLRVGVWSQEMSLP